MDLHRLKQSLRLRSGRKKSSNLSETQTMPMPPDSKTRDSEKPPSKAATSRVARAGSDKIAFDIDRYSRTKPKTQTKSVEADEHNNPQAIEVKESSHTTNEPATQNEEEQDRKTRLGVVLHDDKASTVDTGDESLLDSQRRDTIALDTSRSNESSDDLDFDLRPPKVSSSRSISVESMADLLFSPGHLNTLLYHPRLLSHFTTFLHQHWPDDHRSLLRYIEISKAIAAAEYANAVAGTVDRITDVVGREHVVTINDEFRKLHSADFASLVEDALPVYITYSLVKTISAHLTNQITGCLTHATHSTVGGLSEVFCLSDPNQHDNPIIYASEEFHRLTGYGRSDTIGYNCRFLQGAKTRRKSPANIKANLEKGHETYETILNYRRDGRPFINVLMVAPLFDNTGRTKYNIGAQIDVTDLVAEGAGLDGFEKYLSMQHGSERTLQSEATLPEGDGITVRKAQALAKLQALSRFFDMEEYAVVKSHNRMESSSFEDNSGGSISSNVKSTRKIVVDPDISDEEEDDVSRSDTQLDWTLGQEGPSGPSGNLPGVYEKYMLIRPSPSLRIIFVAHRLQSYGKMIQSPFLSHVAATHSTLLGLKESLDTGTPVTARIHFMAERGKSRNGTRVETSDALKHGNYGRACWISATPLIGADHMVGVWMVVFVENVTVKNRSQPAKFHVISKNASIKSTPRNVSGAQDLQPESRSYQIEDKNSLVEPQGIIVGEQQPSIKPNSASVHQGIVITPVEEYQSSSDDFHEVPRVQQKADEGTLSEYKDHVESGDESSKRQTARVEPTSADLDTTVWKINTEQSGEQHDDLRSQDRSPVTSPVTPQPDDVSQSTLMAEEQKDDKDIRVHGPDMPSASIDREVQTSPSQDKDQVRPFATITKTPPPLSPSAESGKEENDNNAIDTDGDTDKLQDELKHQTQCQNLPDFSSTSSRLPYVNYLHRSPGSKGNSGSRPSSSHHIQSVDSRGRTRTRVASDDTFEDEISQKGTDTRCEGSPVSVD